MAIDVIHLLGSCSNCGSDFEYEYEGQALIDALSPLSPVEPERFEAVQKLRDDALAQDHLCSTCEAEIEESDSDE